MHLSGRRKLGSFLFRFAFNPGSGRRRPEGRPLTWVLDALSAWKLPWFRSRLPAESPRHPERTVPRPGALRKQGRASSFAGHGVSVACLVIYKGREGGDLVCKWRLKYKNNKIKHLLEDGGGSGLDSGPESNVLAGFGSALRDGVEAVGRGVPGRRCAPGWSILTACRWEAFYDTRGRKRRARIS
jgi:hypothetical protein